MTELSSQQCRNISAYDKALDLEIISACCLQLNPQWQLNKEEQASCYTCTFNNYYQTKAFVNVIAQIAHRQHHHAKLPVSYHRCTVTDSTHSADGFSINDFVCAAKINTAQNL